MISRILWPRMKLLFDFSVRATGCGTMWQLLIPQCPKSYFRHANENAIHERNSRVVGAASSIVATLLAQLDAPMPKSANHS